MHRTITKLATTLVLASALTAQAQKSDPVSIVFKVGGKTVTVVVQDSDAKAYVGDKLVQTVRLPLTGTVPLKDRRGRALAWIHPFPRQLVDFGRLRKRAHLGVNVAELDEALAQHLDLDRDACVIVLSVAKGKAADQAGIRKHDIILGIDDERGITRSKLTKLLDKKKPGEEIEIELLRGGRRKTVRIKLGEQTWSTVSKPWSTGITYRWPNNLNLISPQTKNFTLLKSGAYTFSPGFQSYDLLRQAAPDELKAELQKLRQELARLEKLLEALKKKSDGDIK